MDDLLKRLISWEKTEREAALREIRALPEEQFVQLLALEVERYPVAQARLFRTFYGVVDNLPLILFAPAFTGVYGEHAFLLLILMIPACLVWRIVCELIPRPRAMRTQLFLSKTLSASSDPRIVPVLLTMIQNRLDHHWDGKLRRPLMAALVRLCPYVRADHASLFTERHHQIVHALLAPNEAYGEHERTVALLKALEQVGNASDLPVVSKLTEENAWAKMHKKHSGEIEQAAQECMPYLTQRAEEARNARTLLRASVANTTSPDVLLRAAEATNNSTPAQELLRAESRNMI